MRNPRIVLKDELMSIGIFETTDKSSLKNSYLAEKFENLLPIK